MTQIHDADREQRKAQSHNMDCPALLQRGPCACRAPLTSNPIVLVCGNCLTYYLPTGKEGEPCPGCNTTGRFYRSTNDVGIREFLGRLVRLEWIAWAKEQPDPKTSWTTAPQSYLPSPGEHCRHQITPRNGWCLQCVADYLRATRPAEKATAPQRPETGHPMLCGCPECM